MARIQLEDVALALLLLLGPPLSRGEASGDGAVGLLVRAPDPLVGLFALVAALGAILALATRVPGESRLVDSGGRAWIIGPFIGAGIRPARARGSRCADPDLGRALSDLPGQPGPRARAERRHTGPGRLAPMRCERCDARR